MSCPILTHNSKDTKRNSTCKHETYRLSELIWSLRIGMPKNGRMASGVLIEIIRLISKATPCLHGVLCCIFSFEHSGLLSASWFLLKCCSVHFFPFMSWCFLAVLLLFLVSGCFFVGVEVMPAAFVVEGTTAKKLFLNVKTKFVIVLVSFVRNNAWIQGLPCYIQCL